jgi:ribosome biogenesis GTPase A
LLHVSHPPSLNLFPLPEPGLGVNAEAAWLPVKAGWLLVDNTGITFPNFDRHNGKRAKDRALAMERKREQRATWATAFLAPRSMPMVGWDSC